MKKTLTSILFFCFCFTQTFGQNSKYQFAKRVFKREYKKQEFEIFKGKVEKIDESTFRYGDKVLNIDTEDYSIMNVFSKGIFHPEIIGGKKTIKALTKSQLDTMTTQSQFFYNLSRNDSIRIGEVEELERLNPNSKTKRFVFWLYQRGMANPTECYFELYNNKATKNMTLEEFINGSKLTFYHRGTIII